MFITTGKIIIIIIIIIINIIIIIIIIIIIYCNCVSILGRWVRRLFPSRKYSSLNTKAMLVAALLLVRPAMHGKVLAWHRHSGLEDKNGVLDFKLSPCAEYIMLSFGYFPGV